MNKIQKVIIVLGDKPRNEGLAWEYADRCNRALEYVALKGSPPEWAIVLTGGETVAGLAAESAVANRYVQEQLPRYFSSADKPAVFTEGRSKTTPGNIMHTLNLLRELRIIPTFVAIIGRTSQLPKVQWGIVPQVWDQGHPTFEYIEGVDTTPWWYQLIEYTIMPVVSWFDPHDRWALSLVKKFCRNG